MTGTTQTDISDRVRDAVTRHVEAGELPGAAWWVTDGAVTDSGFVGVHGPDAPLIGEDTIFRISSMSKPVVAVAGMTLVDDGTLDLDADVEDVLPELADRRVLVDPFGSLTDTVPAVRPITVRDVFEFRLGMGLDFTGPWDNPLATAMAEAGLPAGPPAPQAAPEPDEWLRLVGGFPLSRQPGERWLYHTGASVLGVLIARVSGSGLPEFMADRIFEPLGMDSTGFWVPGELRDRFGPHWLPGENGPQEYDGVSGQWSKRPAFPDGGDGLVSTIADLAVLTQTLREGGTFAGHRILSADAVRAMTSVQVPDVDGEGGGWGLGLGVRNEDEHRGDDDAVRRHAGTYGWDGGLGSSWWTDPVSRVSAILLTNQMWTSPEPSPIFQDFWDAAFNHRQ
ncbi:MAG: serine hydrolase domain-containing protein [Nakamurella sp.]